MNNSNILKLVLVMFAVKISEYIVDNFVGCGFDEKSVVVTVVS